MIYSLTVTNSIGESLTFELSNPWASGYAIKTIDGLGTPDMNVNTTPYGIGDGSVLGSIKAEYRLITIILYPLANPTVETMRHQLYRYFQIKKPVLLSFNTENRLVTIDGYVQKIEPNIFDNPESISIEVKCINPYFHKMMKDQTNFYGVVPQFEFPFSVEIDYDRAGDWEIVAPRPIETISTLTCTIYHDGVYISATKYDISISYDGKNWEKAVCNFQPDTYNIADIVYADGKFLAISAFLKRILYSYDGKRWEEMATSTPNLSSTVQTIIYENGMYMVFGRDQCLYSFDGVTWISGTIHSSKTGVTYKEIVYGNGVFLASDTAAANVLYSLDGINWYDSDAQIDGNRYTHVMYGDGKFILAKKTSGVSHWKSAYSTNGKDWIENQKDIPMDVPATSIAGYSDGRFILVQNGGTYVVSKNGLDWFLGKVSIGTVYALFTDENGFILMGSNGFAYSMQPRATMLGPIEFSTYSIDNRSEIEYEGEIDAGLKIIIECQTAPGDIVIYNVDTLDYIQIFAERVEAVTGSPLGPRDVVEINTEPGEKYVRLLRNGVYYNILGAMNRGMTWFTLKQGPNKFTYTTSDEHAAIVMSFSYRDTYAAI